MKFEYSAGAFVYRKRASSVELLLLKRKGSNAYDLPKGHIEKGENAVQAAIREIKEETGLNATFLPYFQTSTRYIFTRKKVKISKSVKFFISRAQSNKVTISDEHSGYVWCDINKAAALLKYKDLLEILPQVKEYILRYEAIQKLNNGYLQLPRTMDTWELSKNFVPGDGPLNPEIMLIGQAPGANEDIQRRPFVGRSGQLLDRLLKETRIERKNVYITSVVQFFPFKNREPTKDEIALCKPFIERQISIIKPKYVVLLGRIAARAILEENSVSENRGHIVTKDGIKYLITLHPSAVLRFPKNEPLLKEALKTVAEELKKDKKENVNTIKD
jgi:DNA polymerase